MQNFCYEISGFDLYKNDLVAGQNSFSCEWFRTKTRFDPEGKGK